MASSCPEWYGGGGGSAASGSNSTFGGSGEADLLGFGQTTQAAHHHAPTNSDNDNQQNNDTNWLGGLTGGLRFGRAHDNSNRASNESDISPSHDQAVSSTNQQQQPYANLNTSNTFHHSTSTTAEEYGEVGLDPSAYSTPKPTCSQMGGAAVVGGVAGAVLAGPLVGIAAASGLATTPSTSRCAV